MFNPETIPTQSNPTCNCLTQRVPQLDHNMACPAHGGKWDATHLRFMAELASVLDPTSAEQVMRAALVDRDNLATLRAALQDVDAGGPTLAQLFTVFYAAQHVAAGN